MLSRAFALSRAAAVSFLCVLSGSARAEESAYCRKVKARAAADAVLLMAPKLTAEALHFPANGSPPLARSSSAGVELRAGLSYSPIDAIRGSLLTRVGEADCRFHAAATALDDVLSQAVDRSELAAHRAEAEQLAARHGDWQTTLKDAERALAAGRLTLTELNDLRSATRELERRWLDAELSVARLEARLDGLPRARAALGRGYVERGNELEQSVSELRVFDPWTLDIAGGIATLGDERPEWFGFAELRYSLGGLFRSSRESSYLQARDAELREAPYERARKLAALRRLASVELANARRKLASTEAELSLLQQALAAFAGVDAAAAAQGRTKVLIERVSAEADAAFLRAKLRELFSLLESIRDS